MLRLKQERVIPLFLLALGLTTLAYSFISMSNILAFIGLGLTFWGALLLYVTNERYVKQSLLSLTTISSLTNLNQMLNELNYQGKAIYLPPKYSTISETKIYIPQYQTDRLPKPEEIQQQGDLTFLKNPEAAFIIPPGLALTQFFEDKLGTNFIDVNLKQLQQNLPKLLIEDLEIAENLELYIEPSEVSKSIANSEPLYPTKNTMIHIKMTNSIYKDISKEIVKPSTGYPIYQIGCPIFSAIACTLTKTTGKPVTIEKMEESEDGKTFEVSYRVHETEERVVGLADGKPVTIEKMEESEDGKTFEVSYRVQVPEERVVGLLEMNPIVQRLSIISLFLIASGALVLTWVFSLVLSDITTWGKDIVLILYGSRTDEAMSLGIGLIAIHYLLIGVVLLILGLITFQLNKMRATRNN